MRLICAMFVCVCVIYFISKTFDYDGILAVIDLCSGAIPLSMLETSVILL